MGNEASSEGERKYQKPVKQASSPQASPEQAVEVVIATTHANDEDEEGSPYNTNNSKEEEEGPFNTSIETTTVQLFQTPTRSKSSSSWSPPSDLSQHSVESSNSMPDPASPISTASSTTQSSNANRKEKRGGFFRRRKKKQDHIDTSQTPQLSLPSPLSTTSPSMAYQGQHSSRSQEQHKSPKAEEEKKEDVVSISIMPSASYGASSINEEGTETTVDDEGSSNTEQEVPNNVVRAGGAMATSPRAPATATTPNRIAFPDLLPASSQSSLQQQDGDDAEDEQPSSPSEHYHYMQSAAGDSLQPRPRASVLSPVMEQNDAVSDSMSTSSQVVSTLLATAQATAAVTNSRSRSTTPTPMSYGNSFNNSSSKSLIVDLGDVASPVAANAAPSVEIGAGEEEEELVENTSMSPSSKSASAALSPAAASNFMYHHQQHESSSKSSSSPLSQADQDQLAPPSLSHKASPTNSLQRAQNDGRVDDSSSLTPVAAAAAAAAAEAASSPAAISSLGSTQSSSEPQQPHDQKERHTRLDSSPPRGNTTATHDASSPKASQVQRESETVHTPQVSPIATILELSGLLSPERESAEDILAAIASPPQQPQLYSQTAPVSSKSSPAESSLSQSPGSAPARQQGVTPLATAANGSSREEAATTTTTVVPSSIELKQQQQEKQQLHRESLPKQKAQQAREDSGPPKNITAPALDPSPVASPREGNQRKSFHASPTSNSEEFSEENDSDTENVNTRMPTATPNAPAAGLSAPSHSSSAALALATASMANSKAIRTKTTADIIRSDMWSPDLATVLSALKHITMEAASDKARSLIARTGGVLAVVRAMETHSSNSQIQVAGCQALEKLALDSDNEVAIEQVGGVETILAAMMGHFKDAAVQEAAWAALWNLTCTNATKDMTLDTEGGMAAIVAAMKEHMECPAVQKNACGALANLCQNNLKRMEAFAKANGFSVIATALQRYWNSDAEVRAEACFAMTALCEGSANQLHASRTTTLATVPHSSTTAAVSTPLAHTALFHAHSAPAAVPSSNGSVASANRGYLPQRFTGGPGGGAVVPPSVLNTSNLRPQLHYSTSNLSNRGGMDSDLHSLASLSYFEEEVFDD
ncbi:hypothetical protein ACA910_005333 [Epithemia clementina (nom. ined.)]